MPGRSATEQAAPIGGRCGGRLRQDRHDTAVAHFGLTATALAGAAGVLRSGCNVVGTGRRLPGNIKTIAQKHLLMARGHEKIQ